MVCVTVCEVDHGARGVSQRVFELVYFVLDQLTLWHASFSRKEAKALFQRSRVIQHSVKPTLGVWRLALKKLI